MDGYIVLIHFEEETIIECRTLNLFVDLYFACRFFSFLLHTIIFASMHTNLYHDANIIVMIYLKDIHKFVQIAVTHNNDTSI